MKKTILLLVTLFLSNLNSQVVFVPAGNPVYEYLSAVSKHAGLTLKDETIKTLINTYFPDLRAAVQGIQHIFITGNESTQVQETYADIYKFILDTKTTFDNIYDFVIDNYTNRPNALLGILGRPFYKWLRDNYPDTITNKGFNLISISKSYNVEYTSAVDPVIHLISYMVELKKILNG